MSSTTASKIKTKLKVESSKCPRRNKNILEKKKTERTGRNWIYETESVNYIFSARIAG
jgi:hypothetical protein